MKILVVDDNKSNLYMLETLLKGSGYDVITAINGVEALEKVQQEKPEMIISDILMPKMDGFQLCRELKKDEKLKDIPVLFYSATYTDEESRKLALSIGAVDYIIKPKEPDEFIKIVKKVLDEYGKGELKPTEKPLEEKVYMKLYNERLIQKLEKKMLDLEKSEKYIRRLNSVLLAVRSVNQLIIREKDRDVLLQKACDILIEARGYDAAWLGFLRDNKTFATVVASDHRENTSRFCDHMVRGDYPPCIEKALAQKDLIMILDKSRECGDCFFKDRHIGKEAAIIRVEHADRLFGLLAISLVSDVTVDEEEKQLLKEVAGDIAFAFYSMELEEERKKLEQQKEKARKEAEFYADVLAHDVGNINQITMGYLYLLQIAKDEETKKKNVIGIKKSIMNSKRLAESIKTLKIIKDTKIEKFDLNKSIERSIGNIKEYSNKEIEVKLDIDKKYYVKANDFLDKVFFNILENSVEFIFKEKVIIDIKTEEKDGFCNVHIHDNGIGISKEKREDILENLETLSKRTGMGFYLTKKILEKFNGKFDIKDVKKGTEIVVSIPVINGGSARNVHAQRPDERNERRGR